MKRAFIGIALLPWPRRLGRADRGTVAEPQGQRHHRRRALRRRHMVRQGQLGLAQGQGRRAEGRNAASGRHAAAQRIEARRRRRLEGPRLSPQAQHARRRDHPDRGQRHNGRQGLPGRRDDLQATALDAGELSLSPASVPVNPRSRIDLAQRAWSLAAEPWGDRTCARPKDAGIGASAPHPRPRLRAGRGRRGRGRAGHLADSRDRRRGGARAELDLVLWVAGRPGDFDRRLFAGRTGRIDP